MIVNGESVTFEKCDEHFLSVFGEEAEMMVLDYLTFNKLPFIYDTYQLAAFLKVGRKTLFDTVNNADKLYRKVLVPKKNGGVRETYSPSPVLKKMQRIIADKILSKFPVSPYATAYRKGKGLYDNANIHIGKNYILKLDLKDFFGSIQFYRIYNTVFNTRYFPKQIGTLLTILCCRDNTLAQGAVTSPAISNIVMKHFDDVMGEWCRKRDISYTRYSDDITFSSNKPLFNVKKKAENFLESLEFSLNESKTHFLSKGSKHTVTGLTVNNGVCVPREYKRSLRREIHIALKYEPISADDEGIKKLNRLLGKNAYILQIEPDNEYFKGTHKLLLERLNSVKQGEEKHE